MRAWVFSVLVAGATLGAASNLAAQSQPRPQPESRRDDDRRDRSDDDDWWNRDDRGRGGSGPAFCRSGAGHPVFGRQWCRDKGFGLANDRWSRVSWPDVILGGPRSDRRTLDRGELIDVLGDVVFGRVERRVLGTGQRGVLTGDWFRDGARSGVQVEVGGQPFARLLDLDGDRRVDVVEFRD